MSHAKISLREMFLIVVICGVVFGWISERRSLLRTIEGLQTEESGGIKFVDPRQYEHLDPNVTPQRVLPASD